MRSPEDEELYLALYSLHGFFNPLRLMVHIGNTYGISNEELWRLIDYLEVTEGGYFELPMQRPASLTKPEIAKQVKQLDPRLTWQQDRWLFA